MSASLALAFAVTLGLLPPTASRGDVTRVQFDPEAGGSILRGPPVGPGRSCDQASLRDPYVALICTDDGLAKAWLELNQVGYALRYQIGDEDYRRTMRPQSIDSWKQLVAACPIDPNRTLSAPARQSAVACIKQRVAGDRDRFLGLLTGEAEEEARQRAEEHVALQQKLIDLGYLTGPADGNYGPATRAAVLRFRADYKLGPSGLMSDRTARQLTNASKTAAELLEATQRREAETRDTPPPAPTSQAPAPTPGSVPPARPEVRSWATASGLAGTDMKAAFDIPDIASSIRRTLGKEYDTVFDQFLGLGGDGELVGGHYVVATACTRHSCTIDGSFLALDLDSRAVYAAIATYQNPLTVVPPLTQWPSVLTRKAGPWIAQQAEFNSLINGLCFPRTLAPGDQDHLETVAGTFEIHSDGNAYTKHMLVSDTSCVELNDLQALSVDMVWPATGPAKLVVFAIGMGAACEPLFSIIDFSRPPFKLADTFGNCNPPEQRRIVGTDLIYSFARRSSTVGPETKRIPLGR